MQEKIKELLKVNENLKKMNDELKEEKETVIITLNKINGELLESKHLNVTLSLKADKLVNELNEIAKENEALRKELENLSKGDNKDELESTK